LAGVKPGGALARNQIGKMLAQFRDIAADMARRDTGLEKLFAHIFK
jgi:hypothetical protein